MFFKDFKEDLSQAVNELIADGGLEESFDDDQMINTLDEEIKENTAVDLEEEEEIEEDNIEEFEEDMDDDSVDEELLKELFEDEEISLEGEEPVEEVQMEEKVEQIVEEAEEIKVPAVEPVEEIKEIVEEKIEELASNDFVAVPEMSLADKVVKDEVTVITKGTVIHGNITSDGSLEIMGSIHGDIDCLGKLTIVGSVVGNSMASDIFVNTKRLEGSINSEGSVKVSADTVVIGDITAASGVIAGAVKGEIDINGPIIVDSTAIVKGNINAKSVQINNGAVIDGFCSLSYSQVDMDSVFAKK